MEAGHIDLAVHELEQNILIEHPYSDPEAQEKSRLALCSLLYQSAASLPQNYRRVVQHLETHLDHFAVTPESVRARYQLADSYRQLVAHSTVNRSALSISSEKARPEAFEHFLEESKKSWRRAAEEFVKLEELIKNKELATLLSLKQQMEIPFHIADCYFNLGEYENALRKYEELANRWDKHERGLQALGETIRCYASMRDFEQLRKRSDEIRERLATTEGLTENKRQQWIEWLNQVNKPPEPNRSGETTNEQPIIIKQNRDEPKVINERGPMLDQQK